MQHSQQMLHIKVYMFFKRLLMRKDKEFPRRHIKLFGLEVYCSPGEKDCCMLVFPPTGR